MSDQQIENIKKALRLILYMLKAHDDKKLTEEARSRLIDDAFKYLE